MKRRTRDRIAGALSIVVAAALFTALVMWCAYQLLMNTLPG